MSLRRFRTRIVSFAALGLLIAPLFGCSDADRAAKPDSPEAKTESKTASETQNPAPKKPPVDATTATPEGSYALLVEAIENKDYNALGELTTDRTQGMLAGTVVMVSGLIKMSDQVPQLKASIEATPEELDAAMGKIETILKSHGYGDDPFAKVQEQAQAFMQQAMMAEMQKGSADAETKTQTAEKMIGMLTEFAAPVENKSAFIHEMKKAIDTINLGPLPDPFEQIVGELGEVTIDGEVAKGTYVTKEGKTEHITFVKDGDAWKLDVDPTDEALGE